ncbi:hypothetical protein [Anaerostipes sp.]|uniref:hypothetical protein n=1 Tax=Anaerostipes sp. TaxID=1872530 RepID=UPI0025BDEF64|nr:hypothetical protein [Anaerostipes sp.]MBS7008416.1 hypothetical protein [Anaerostipes sp.]
MNHIKKVILWIMAVCIFFAWSISVNGEQTLKQAGQRCNVVLFVQFPEDEKEDYFNSHQESLSYDGNSELLAGFDAYERILNGKGEKNRTSLATYIDAISEGKLNIKNLFSQYRGEKIIPITMDHNADYYDSYSGEVQFLDETIRKAKNVISPSAEVDLDGDQVVDNLMIFVHYKGDSDQTTLFYPHKADSPGNWDINGKHVGHYVLINTGDLWASFQKQGVVCHEFLHTLGLPDLYRNQSVEGIISYPVQVWDIMGGSSEFLQYPLSWQRKQLGWIDLSEQNQSGTYTLYAPGTKGRDYSFVIKSPMSDTEFFVVEYRKQGKQRSEELDTHIPGSGLIIYRVDTTKEEYGNIGGDDYLYVFRPGNKDNLSESFLSENAGRTSFGTSDWSKGIKDNAITYSDGRNSGIVIDQVGNAEESISFRLTFPDYDALALWNRIYTGEDKGEYDIVSSVNGDVYFAAESQQGVEIRKRTGKVWTKVGGMIQNACRPKLVAVGSDIYAIYSEKKEYKTVFSKFENGSWTQIFKSDGYGNGKIAAVPFDHGFYAVYDEGDKLKAKRVADKEVTDMGDAADKLKAVGEPGIALYQGAPVLIFRDIFGSNILKVMRYVDGSWSLLKEINTEANSFDCVAIDGRLYISSTGMTGTSLYEYDGKLWSNIDISQLPEGSGCKLSVYQGNLAVGRLEDGQTTAKLYIRKEDVWTQIGNYITKSADDSECRFAVSGEAVYGAVNCSNGLGIFLKGEEFSESGNTGDTATESTNSTVSGSTTAKPTRPTTSAGTERTEKNTAVSPSVSKPKPKKKMTYQVARYAKIQVTWKKSKGRSGYAVYARGGKKGPFKKVKTVKKAAKTTVFLKPGKKYYFKVKPYRTMKNKKRRYDKMKKAKGKNAVNIIQITYSNISGYQGYVVEMKTGSGRYKKVKETSRGGTIRYEKKKISLKKKYQFRLKGFRKVKGKRIYTQISVKKR